MQGNNLDTSTGDIQGWGNIFFVYGGANSDRICSNVSTESLFNNLQYIGNYFTCSDISAESLFISVLISYVILVWTRGDVDLSLGTLTPGPAT